MKVLLRHQYYSDCLIMNWKFPLVCLRSSYQFVCFFVYFRSHWVPLRRLTHMWNVYLVGHNSKYIFHIPALTIFCPKNIYLLRCKVALGHSWIFKIKHNIAAKHSDKKANTSNNESFSFGTKHGRRRYLFAKHIDFVTSWFFCRFQLCVPPYRVI